MFCFPKCPQSSNGKNKWWSGVGGQWGEMQAEGLIDGWRTWGGSNFPSGLGESVKPRLQGWRRKHTAPVWQWSTTQSWPRLPCSYGPFITAHTGALTHAQTHERAHTRVQGGFRRWLYPRVLRNVGGHKWGCIKGLGSILRNCLFTHRQFCRLWLPPKKEDRGRLSSFSFRCGFYSGGSSKIRTDI